MLTGLALHTPVLSVNNSQHTSQEKIIFFGKIYLSVSRRKSLLVAGHI